MNEDDHGCFYGGVEYGEWTTKTEAEDEGDEAVRDCIWEYQIQERGCRLPRSLKSLVAIHANGRVEKLVREWNRIHA